MARSFKRSHAVALFVLLAFSGAATADPAKGSATLKARSIQFRFAYLVQGPDTFDPKKTVRELILSPQDVGAKIAACKTLSCASGILEEGLTVDFVEGPRLNYWLVMNKQMVQHSGTVVRAAFSAQPGPADRLTGRLQIDDSAAGGPKIEAEFDAPLVKEFATAR